MNPKILIIFLFSVLFFTANTIVPILASDVLTTVTIVIKDQSGAVFYERVRVKLIRHRAFWFDETIWEGEVNGTKTLQVPISSDSLYHFNVKYPIGKTGSYSYKEIRYPEDSSGDFLIPANATITITLPIAKMQIRVEGVDKSGSIKLIHQEKGQTIEFNILSHWSGIAYPGLYKALIEIPDLNYREVTEISLNPGDNTIYLSLEKWSLAEVIKLEGVDIYQSPDRICAWNDYLKIVFSKLDDTIQLYYKTVNGNWALLTSFKAKWGDSGEVFKLLGSSFDDRYEDEDWLGTYKFVAFPVVKVLKNHIVITWINIKATRQLWQSPKFWMVLGVAATIAAIILTCGLAAVSGVSIGTALNAVITNSVTRLASLLLINLGSASFAAAGEAALALFAKLGLAFGAASIIATALTQLLSDYPNKEICVITADITPLGCELATWAMKNSSATMKSALVPMDVPGSVNLVAGHLVHYHNSGTWVTYDNSGDYYFVWDGEENIAAAGDLLFNIFVSGHNFIQEPGETVIDADPSSSVLAYNNIVHYNSTLKQFKIAAHRIAIYKCIDNLQDSDNDGIKDKQVLMDAIEYVESGGYGVTEQNKTWDFTSIAKPESSGAAYAGRYGILPIYEVQNVDKFYLNWHETSVGTPVYLTNVKSDAKIYTKPASKVYAGWVRLDNNLPLALQILPETFCSLSFKQYWDLSVLSSALPWAGEPSIFVDGIGEVPLNVTNPDLSELFSSPWTRFTDWLGEVWNNTLFTIGSVPFLGPYLIGAASFGADWLPWLLLGIGGLMLLLFILNPAWIMLFISLLGNALSWIANAILSFLMNLRLPKRKKGRMTKKKRKLKLKFPKLKRRGGRRR